MALDTADHKDTQPEAAQESANAKSMLNPAARRSIQGLEHPPAPAAEQDQDVSALQARVEQLRAEKAAEEQGRLAVLERAAADKKADAANPPAEQVADTKNDPPPDHRHKIAIGERGDAERAETGAEKTEKEVFTGRSPEAGG